MWISLANHGPMAGQSPKRGGGAAEERPKFRSVVAWCRASTCMDLMRFSLAVLARGMLGNLTKYHKTMIKYWTNTDQIWSCAAKWPHLPPLMPTNLNVSVILTCGCEGSGHWPRWRGPFPRILPYAQWMPMVQVWHGLTTGFKQSRTSWGLQRMWSIVVPLQILQ